MGSSGRMRRPRTSTLSPRSFQTLRPRRPRRHRAPQRLDQAVGPVGPVQQTPVEVAEREEPSGMGAVVTFEILLELPAPAPIEVHHGAHVARVHEVEDVSHVGLHPLAPVRQPAPEVGVEVDGADTRLRRNVGRHLECRHRSVRAQAWTARLEPPHRPCHGKQRFRHQPVRERRRWHLFPGNGGVVGHGVARQFQMSCTMLSITREPKRSSLTGSSSMSARLRRTAPLALDGTDHEQEAATPGPGDLGSRRPGIHGPVDRHVDLVVGHPRRQLALEDTSPPGARRPGRPDRRG